jgi:putative transcriptional regulator
MTQAKADGAVPAEVRPTHHVTQELLVDYASGALAEAAAILVASHLVFCPVCRGELAEAEALGGALLGQAEPVAMAPQALDRVLARLDRPEPPEPAPIAGLPGLPRPLARHIGRPLESLAWRSLIPGLQMFPLQVAGGDKICLLRIKPGRGMPRHTHGGNEMTLVLGGSYSDRLGEFQRGDVAILDDTVDHRPVAGRHGDCICLAVTDAPLKLTGPIGRLFRPFVNF